MTASRRRSPGLDARSARTLLEGRGTYGAGRDDLVRFVGDLTAPPAPAELRGEAEALLAFRAGRAYLAQGTPRHRVATPVAVPARRVAPASTGMPVIGSVFAVAASAAVGVLAWTASLPDAPAWTVNTPGVPAQPASHQVADPGTGGGGAAPASGAGAAGQSRPGGSGAARGNVRSGAGSSSAAISAPPSVDGVSPVNIAARGNLPIPIPLPTPAASGSPADTAGSGTSAVPGGGGTDHAPNPSPTRPEMNGGSLGGGASLGAPSPAASAAATSAPAVVASASAAPTQSASSAAVGVASVPVLPRSMKGVCNAWLAQGGSRGRNADDAKFVPLLAVTRTAAAADEACRRLDHN